ncbi:xanthine dehydrogenase molybdenum binding subunit apoprotein [Antricoccus suffuscus]|uniref:Xanthine dehydrogenase molybdenum binding subunit apoprotein n=1 Tax=Antricoccus suffuscus TaxID=1629062 RepID=A0A2T0ZX99_9ACTN|nr:xanthine dehydrogenase family protein molybdopterin-binding subunit [Antricoccus suffuscus]PRZ40981.1 xanthine dehydrogenase molybdenum binding subunit apoprotein [Antricoccus suffuscus]
MASDQTPFTWVGQRRPRHEDARMLRGRGRFTDDIMPSRALHASFVRSSVAAGTITSIDTSQTADVPGVVAVFTAKNLGADGLIAVLERDGFIATEMPILAHDRVRYCGEPIAIVVADSAYSAEDGAESVIVEIDQTPAVMDLKAASSGGVHDDAPDGTLVDLRMYVDDQVEPTIDGSFLALTEQFSAARVHASPMECRAALAEVDDRSGQLVVHTSTQVPHQMRSAIAQSLGMAEGAVRVIAPDVGGGFGVKCVTGREEIATAAAARKLGRTVRWSEDRRDSLMASFTGHEQHYAVRAGFTEDGILTAISADIRCDIGAYSVYPFTCGVEPLMACSELPGVYKVGRYAARGRGYATNKSPTAPYRGVSRPQIVMVMERLMDKAAVRLGIDPIDIRRRNLIRYEDFPYTGPNALTYELGSYAESLDLCAKEVESAGWRQRATDGNDTDSDSLYGIGIACFSERSAYGTPTMGARKMGMTPGYDVSHIKMDPSGHVTVTTGTCGHGQGHETTFAQVVADKLGIDPAHVHLRQGDTDLTSYGWGTFASRSLVIGGMAARNAAGVLADNLKRVAAELLEADPRDIRLADGKASIDSVSISLSDLASRVHFRAHEFTEQPEQLLEARGESDPDGCFSNATHAALVRIDKSTGEAHVVDYLVVEDCGVVVNPLIVEGQVRGGVAQGIAAALYEHLEYDADGQPLTATLMDYLIPTACEIPPVTIHHLETPNAANELGAKGMGEGGAIGAPSAVLSAVNDALRFTGTQFDRLPVLPPDIVRALGANDNDAIERAAS